METWTDLISERPLRTVGEVVQQRVGRFRVVPEALEPRFRLVTRGAETASEAEIEQNPRAKPVRLRVVERVKEAA